MSRNLARVNLVVCPAKTNLLHDVIVLDRTGEQHIQAVVEEPCAPATLARLLRDLASQVEKLP